MPDSLNRTVKQLVDSGRASTFEEAERIFGGYKLHVHLAPETASQRSAQIALLTIIQLGKRTFLGGVEVSGTLDVPLEKGLGLEESLAAAVSSAGGLPSAGSSLPTIEIGPPAPRAASFHIRLLTAGWRAGIAAIDEPDSVSREDGYVMPLAAIAAAALAVNEAFLHVSAATVLAGNRTTGISLWGPQLSSWMDNDTDGPLLSYLPSSVWLLGLGHLGQAYAWGLGSLPYGAVMAERPLVVLQDIDRVTSSTFSTSVLSECEDVGLSKARVVARWLESKGFETRLVERIFDAATSRSRGDPDLLLSGVDNVEGRQALESAGCRMVVEAGLGSLHDDFQSIRIHTLPGSRLAADIWSKDSGKGSATSMPAYSALLKTGVLDQCGLTELAGKAVGAAFVGMFAASLVLSEVLRVLHGGNANEVMDLSLVELEHRTLVPNKIDFSRVNPGFLPVEAR
ncbi:thiamine biosynthesis protein ThiF [Paraburkholderia sp. BCC1884]|uniref:thiamine biosynthesis protein ThiF n=1 Tax=Paraburkholderia sp. BCC1884 TaxID=2562668 RepID=UPI0016434A58|nr:thiamine biosynthesis protein ThiF [Paraburkholderia sp. BCC1884]